MRIDEIETRLSAIKAEMENEGADLDALTVETDALIEERKGLLEAAEKRAKILEGIAQGKSGEGETIMNNVEEVRNFGLDSAEYRSAYLKSIRGLELNDVEQRAMTTNAASAGAAVPTQTANKIVDKIKQYAPLLDKVELLRVAGNVTFAVEGVVADAQNHAEGATITADADTLVPVTLNPKEITKLVTVSKSVMTMSVDAFEDWLVEKIAEMLARKISSLIIAAATPSSSDYTGLTKENILAALGALGGYATGANFVCSGTTLYTVIAPLEDNSKNKFISNVGDKFYIYGKEVLVDDNVAGILVGNFKKVVADLAEDINVVNQFVARENSYDFLGSCMFDAKLAIADAFKLIATA